MRDGLLIDFFSEENSSLFTALDAKPPGTDQVSEVSVVPGLRAISGRTGGALARTLQLREAPSGTRVHAVIGTRWNTDEETLMKMAIAFEVPVLGYSNRKPF